MTLTGKQEDELCKKTIETHNLDIAKELDAKFFAREVKKHSGNRIYKLKHK